MKLITATLGLVIICAVVIEDQLARRAIRAFWRERLDHRSLI